MNKKSLAVTATLVLAILLVACGPKPAPARPAPVERPAWSEAEVEKAIEKLVEVYRADPVNFMGNRTYIWVGTWIWPETVGINERHLTLLKKIFYEGDDAVREVVLNVVMMNIPAEKLKLKEKKFLRDLVLLDTELKERKANVPPPSDPEVIIEAP